MTSAERKLVTNYLDETVARVLDETIRRFSSKQLTFKPEPGCWSIVQIVEHLTIVERLVMIKIEQVLGRPEAEKESAWSGRDNDFLTEAKRRSRRLEAPEIIQPQSSSDLTVIFKQFEAAHNSLREFAVTTEAELRRFCFAHPVYGDLDCYQWLLLAGGAHCERHLAQIREAFESVQFPK